MEFNAQLMYIRMYIKASNRRSRDIKLVSSSDSNMQ